MLRYCDKFPGFCLQCSAGYLRKYSFKFIETKTVDQLADDQKHSMEITCKVLEDTRKLKLILQREAKVSDLIDQLKDDLGSENEYQLICLGRIMLECDTLSRYTQSEKLPILIKTFTPENIMEATREIRYKSYKS